MKNKIRLVSMVQYIDERWCADSVEFETEVRNYANFLKQPLTLGMFVPVDEEGKPIEPTEENLKEYNKALENVLFEGFEWDKFKSYLYFISLPGTNITFEYHIDEKQIYWKERCIEDLVVYAVILTESAIKKYNI